MIEARIECLCREIRIPDLDLFLKEGDVECIPARSAKISIDLQQAIRIKAVDVLYRTKGRTMANRHEPPWLMRHDRNVQRNIEPEKKPVPAGTAGVIDQTKLINIIQETIRTEISLQIKREMEQFRRKLAADIETLFSQSIEVAVGTLSRKVDSIEIPPPQVRNQIPDFKIPDIVVPSDNLGGINSMGFDDEDDEILIFMPEIKSEGIQIEDETATDTGDLDSAAEALRGLKTKK